MRNAFIAVDMDGAATVDFNDFKVIGSIKCSFLHISYLSNTPTNLCTPLYCILLYCVVLNCIVLLIYCYVDIIQYNGVHKFVGVLDNPPIFYIGLCLYTAINQLMHIFSLEIFEQEETCCKIRGKMGMYSKIVKCCFS